MASRKRIIWMVAVLLAVLAGALAAHRLVSKPTESPPVVPTPEPVTQAGEREHAVDTESAALIRSKLLEANERSQLDTVGVIAGELELSAVERDAITAAVTEMQAGRRVLFSRLLDESAEAEITYGLVALQRAFDSDVTAALGTERASRFMARWNDSYGKQAKPEAAVD